MLKLSKKDRELWVFFIDPNTRKRKFFPGCRRCMRSCKQSYRAKVVECPRYATRKKRR